MAFQLPRGKNMPSKVHYPEKRFLANRKKNIIQDLKERDRINLLLASSP
jgi:hypothetical protein